MIEIAPSQVYTIRDVAEYLKCSTRKIHRLVASRQLRGFKIGNQRRFKGEEILQFIERQDVGASEPLVAPAVQAERLYSLREVSAILQVSAGDVAHMLRRGQLSGFRVGMDWRCWGRDLLKLTAPVEDEPETLPFDALQPPLLQPEEEPLLTAQDPRLKGAPARLPRAPGAEASDHSIEKAA